HGPQPFDGGEWFAGGFGIYSMNLIGEMFQWFELPKRVLAEHLQEPSAAFADVSLPERCWNIRQGDGRGRCHVAQPMQIPRQVGAEAFLECLKPAFSILNR